LNVYFECDPSNIQFDDKSGTTIQEQEKTPIPVNDEIKKILKVKAAFAIHGDTADMDDG